MKYITAAFVFGLLSAGICSAETIDEVYFNPTRWGQYENLRVTGSLKAKNIIVQKDNAEDADRTLNAGLSSSETITVTASSGTIIAGTSSSNGGYGEISTISGQKIDMPYTKFHVANQMLVKGQVAQFVDTTATSTISTLFPVSGVSGSPALEVYVAGENHYLQMTNSMLSVQAASGEITTHQGDTEESLHGFKLGNYDISLNTSDGFDSSCSLAWLTRKATVQDAEGNSTSKDVKVLGLDCLQ